MEVEEAPVAVSFAGRALPNCFHVSGQFANHIVDCHGVCVRTSTEVRFVEDETNSSKLYYQYISKWSTDSYRCTICDKDFSAKDGESRRTASNIIKHVK